MTRPPLPLTALSAVACSACLIQALAAGSGQSSRIVPRPVVLIGGTIIDGTGAPARRNDAIVVQGGRIKAMGLAASKRAPKDARLIDASNKWIVPGLIDGAVHLSQTGGLDARPDLLPNRQGRDYASVFADIRRSPAPYLRAYLCAGITAVLNVGGPAWTFELRQGRADDALSPRIATTGPWIALAAPPALQIAADEAFWVPDEKTGPAALVDRLVGQRADLVAVRLGLAEAGPDADAALVRAVVAESHARKQRVLVDVETVSEIRAAVEARADALVSRVAEEIPDDLVARMVSQRVIVVPAMAATESAVQVFSGKVTVEDFERGCAPESSVESLGEKSLEASSTPKMEGNSERLLAGEQRNVRRLVAAGGTVVAGSGAGDLRVLHGSSLHREFALMSGAGLAPMQILLSATSDAARLLGQEAQLGQLKEGLAADLVLLDADPTADIRNARKVSLVIKGGAIYER